MPTSLARDRACSRPSEQQLAIIKLFREIPKYQGSVAEVQDWGWKGPRYLHVSSAH